MPVENELLSAESDFSLRLLRKLSDKPSASLILSPLSISTAYAMVHCGANGTAKNEIMEVILKGATHKEFTKYFSDLAGSIENVKTGVEVKIANRLFIKNGQHIKISYLDQIKKNYKATAQNIDFRVPDMAAEEVNNFVSNATCEKIKKLVTRATFVNGSAVLINALYLDAKWMDVFDSGCTKSGHFHLKQGETQEVDFMHDRKKSASYFEDAQVQVALLGFKDPKMKFAVFLPKERFGLTDFVNDLTGEKFQKYIQEATGETLNIKFPRIKLETAVELPKILTSLGMSTLFSPSADLSGICPGLVIGDSKHKAVIEVNETGTVAAAATSVEFGRCLVQTVDFIADHPFLFAVIYNNHPVFVGMFRGHKLENSVLS